MSAFLVVYDRLQSLSVDGDARYTPLNDSGCLGSVLEMPKKKSQ